MPKISLRNLALKAIRAKKALQTQEASLKALNDELIQRAEGSTLSTELGLVIVTERTFNRDGQGFINIFDEGKFMSLTAAQQMLIKNMGIVRQEQRRIAGQIPRVQFRFNTEKN